MESVLRAFSVGFLLRSLFAGFFAVLAYSISSTGFAPAAAEKIVTSFSIAVAISLFSGVVVYGLHRSLFYPLLEWYFDSECGRSHRRCCPLIQHSTIVTLLRRWDYQWSDPPLKSVNTHLNAWGDILHFQFTSTHCIALGSLVSMGANPGRYVISWPLVVAAALLFVAAIISNWRHHALIDYVIAKEIVPNKAPEPTPGAVTPRATEGTPK